MKKALFLLSILLLVLLAGCNGEAREPAPDWPDRVTGDYDGALTFTFAGAEPERAGVDSLTGRMTALFPTADGNTLALGWRRVTGAEAELLEDFLAGTDGQPGIWEKDSTAPNALESYVRLGNRWFCLSAACDSPETDLLSLVDGTVEAKAGEETALPRAASSAWLEELPWEEDWVCLWLGRWELEPETGKEALHTLLSSYNWLVVDPAAQEKVYDPELGRHRRLTTWETSIDLQGKTKLRFHLRENGDLYWNGTLRRPLGPGGGAGLLAKYEDLEKTGDCMTSSPALTLSGGEADYEAHLYSSYWTHIARSGHKQTYGGFDLLIPYRQVDWFSAGEPILNTDGELTLHFTGREPDSLRLFAFGDWETMATTPVELREGRFTPFAGANTYVLNAEWDQVKEGGFGRGTYILLINGGEGCGPEVRENEEILLSFTETDPYGCSFTLENRGERFLDNIYDNTGYYSSYNSEYLYTLLRRTGAGGWAWVKPLRSAREFAPAPLHGGESQACSWDWSYAYGPLEPGEYCLSLWCSLAAVKQQEEVFFLRKPFTVVSSAPPDLGPLTLSPLPEGFTASLELLSPGHWVQTLLAPDYHWVTERDFSLYRLEKDETLSYIPPAYRLPAGYSCYQCVGEVYSLAGRENRPLEVDLAAQYGELGPGTYVLRRRFLCFTAEEWSGVNSLVGTTSLSRLTEWRTVPPERLVYGDMVLTITD